MPDRAEHVVVRLSNSQVAWLAACPSAPAGHSLPWLVERADDGLRWLRTNQQDDDAAE